MNYFSSLKLQNFLILKNLSAGKNKNYHKYLRNEFDELQETIVFILFVLELLLLTFNKKCDKYNQRLAKPSWEKLLPVEDGNKYKDLLPDIKERVRNIRISNPKWDDSLRNKFWAPATKGAVGVM